MTSLKLSNVKTQRTYDGVVLSAVKLNQPVSVEHKSIELNSSVGITYLTVFLILFNKLVSLYSKNLNELMLQFPKISFAKIAQKTI